MYPFKSLREKNRSYKFVEQYNARNVTRTLQNIARCYK